MGFEPNTTSFDDKDFVENVGVKKRNDLESDHTKELEDYSKRCLELEEKRRMMEEKCLMLEAEVEGLKKRNKELEEQMLSIRRVVGEGEKGNEGMVVDLTDEENDGDKFVQLMIENKVLECEKTKAESEAEVWKGKIKELESRVYELESKVKLKAGNESSIGITDELPPTTRIPHPETTDSAVIGKEKLQDTSGVISTCKLAVADNVNLQSSGTPDLPVEGERIILSRARNVYGSLVKKRLAFEEDGKPSKKMAPSTPACAQHPFSDVIDISDEDSDSTSTPAFDAPKTEAPSVLDDAFPESGCPLKNDIKTPEKTAEEAKYGCQGNSPVRISAKRKRASNIVTSDSESSDDDNVLICTLRKRQIHGLNTDSEDEIEENPSRRRSVRLRKSEGKGKKDRNTFDPNKPVNLYGNNSSEDEEDSDGEADGSESEGDDLGGFIVNGSESASECASGSSRSLDESEDSLDDFKKTLDKLGRKRGRTLKWDFEGAMLADFGKDPELCMRAVCALYRQQTADEKFSKGTIYLNERGFSQCDATRGTNLAEFLTDGDSEGDLNKTVEELKKHDPKGIKLCMHLATKYSKQLFEIYQNKEDPFFRPP